MDIFIHSFRRHFAEITRFFRLFSVFVRCAAGRGVSRCHFRSALFALFVPLFFFDASVCSEALALDGVQRRPFPLIFQVDYPLVRAKAWLNALDQGARLLAPSIREKLPLPEMGGALAYVAMQNPPYAVTPEMALSNEIKVLLEPLPDDLNTRADLDFCGFSLQMAIIFETRHLVKKMEAAWPKSISNARRVMPDLEDCSLALDALWRANMSLRKHEDQDELLLQNAPDSAVIALMLAENEGLAKLPRKTLENAKRIERLVSERTKSDPASARIWNFLEARAALLRAKAHERLGQKALAEAALSDVAHLLESSFSDSHLVAETFAFRGRLRQERGDVRGMCMDYQVACAKGSCVEMVLALDLCAAKSSALDK